MPFTQKDRKKGGKRTQELHGDEIKERLKKYREKYQQNPKIQAARARKRAQLERQTKKALETQGWEIIHPRTICDAIGIKNGKMFLIEYKRKGARLTERQKLAQKTFGNRFQIVFYLSAEQDASKA